MSKSLGSAGGADLPMDEDLEAALRGPEAEQLDEETAPLDPQTAERTILYVQILDAQQPEPSPIVGAEIEVSGEGLAEPRQLSSDGQGEILIEDCGPGVYTLRWGERQGRVHTLSDDDLGLDTSAYRVLL